MGANYLAASYFFGRFAKRLERLAAALLPRKRRSSDREDMVQETFAEFLVSDVHALDGGPPYSLDCQRQCYAFLCRILRCRCREVRHACRRLPTEPFDAEGPFRQGPSVRGSNAPGSAWWST